MAFLQNTESVMPYLTAIGHWEVFLSYAYQAYLLLARPSGAKLFQPNDGSVLQRLNHLYNRSKHVDKAINSSQVAPGSTLTVWLTNSGLACIDSHLTFDELASILDDLGAWSDAVQDPLTMREKLLAQDGVVSDARGEG
jgi:hypothetical protein